jgi:hypothetical protein
MDTTGRNFKILLMTAAAYSTILTQSRAELFTVSDVSYPHLVITDPASTPVVWHKKSIAFKLVHSLAVRINAR